MNKIMILSSLYLFSLLYTVIESATVSTDKPGQCGSSGQTCPTSYTCVSILSTIPGLEKLSQCAPEAVCGGNRPGTCPTFSAWPEKYQKLQPVCAFTAINNCYNETLGNSSSDVDTVDCYTINVPKGNTTVKIQGIYKCVDADKYITDFTPYNKSIAMSQIESCAGNTSTSKTCNGQGTCGPKTSLGLEYECLCNLGYSKSDNCFVSTSNQCNNLGQCGELGACDTNVKECKCQTGTTGNQCNQCKEGSTESCGGTKAGKCNSNGTCTCNTGYSGQFCMINEGSMGNIIKPYFIQLIISFILTITLLIVKQ